jgi:hypothetical protein
LLLNAAWQNVKEMLPMRRFVAALNRAGRQYCALLDRTFMLTES